jgi:DNA-binding beta-propeller fold protein YncE
VTPAGKVAIADEKSGVSHVAISPDGKTALVTRDGDDRISVLSIDGTKVEYTKRDLFAGLRPYGIDIAANGAIAAIANIGRDRPPRQAAARRRLFGDERAPPAELADKAGRDVTELGREVLVDEQDVHRPRVLLVARDSLPAPERVEAQAAPDGVAR